MSDRKFKNIHCITIEGYTIRTRLSYNPNTDHIGILSSYSYQKKYYEDHKKEFSEYGKQRYIDNKNEINNHCKQYRQDHSLISFLGKQISTNLPKVKKGFHYHHTIYDHLNTSNNVIELSISDHTKLHNKMRREGIEIQHINVRINDYKGF